MRTPPRCLRCRPLSASQSAVATKLHSLPFSIGQSHRPSGHWERLASRRFSRISRKRAIVSPVASARADRHLAGQKQKRAGRRPAGNSEPVGTGEATIDREPAPIPARRRKRNLFSFCSHAFYRHVQHRPSPTPPKAAFRLGDSRQAGHEMPNEARLPDIERHGLGPAPGLAGLCGAPEDAGGRGSGLPKPDNTDTAVRSALRTLPVYGGRYTPTLPR